MYMQLKEGEEKVPVSLYHGHNFSCYKAKGDYYSGTRYKLVVSNNEPAWVYVIGSDLQNHVVKLFPYADNISASLDYKQNNIAIPSESSKMEFLMDDIAGTDYFCILYSQEELDINQLILKLRAAPGSFYTKVKIALGDRMVPIDDILFDENQVGFRAHSDKNIVPLIVEISHKNFRYK